MDKDFEKKVKQKRIRAIAVGVVVLAAVVYLIAGTKIEKADYTDFLKKEIQAARTLYDENKGNVGNEQNQYAKYTVLNFEKQIAEASAVAESEESQYTDKKLAYETLKEQVSAFKKDLNDPVISAEEASALASEGGTKEVTTAIKDGKDLVYTIHGDKLDQPVTMNLMAREEGPYYAEINEILAEKKLQGQVISFYQDGVFGGEIQVKAPIYSEDTETGYVYKVNVEKGRLNFVSEAEVDLDAQTAAFSVEEGGDYVVLLKKIHKEKKEEPLEEAEPEELQTETEEPQVEEPVAGEESVAEEQEPAEEAETEEEPKKEPEEPKKEEPVVEPEDTTITVSLNIHCHTLAADLSKLRDSALEAYVPADGVILSLPEVKVEKGESVYDVLDRVCRDNGIHLEAVYTPSYGADYIEGINYLYEFDAGEQSGWMYTVNGVFPNYGCSDYILEDGDAIVWAYTCDMGKDLGK